MVGVNISIHVLSFALLKTVILILDLGSLRRIYEQHGSTWFYMYHVAYWLLRKVAELEIILEMDIFNTPLPQRDKCSIEKVGLNSSHPMIKQINLYPFQEQEQNL